jgi:chemotaxis response regulator CheB
MAGGGSKHSLTKARKVGKLAASPRPTRPAAAAAPVRRAAPPNARRQPAKKPKALLVPAPRDQAPVPSPPADAPQGLSEKLPASSPPRFPVVGIGMSAGGLEALEQFLKRVPEQSGVAYVVVQHLDPNHSGMLVELLRRASSLPIDQATDGVVVEPNHVYVIPPNRDMSLSRGSLYLFPQPRAPGVHLSVDFSHAGKRDRRCGDHVHRCQLRQSVGAGAARAGQRAETDGRGPT